MKNLKITKEYNKASSNKHNRDVYDVYVNDWGFLQYSVKYDVLFNLYSFYNHTIKKKIAGLTFEKLKRIKEKELKYQINLFQKAGRIKEVL